MKTKEQERKALQQIKSILDEMGPESYVGIAFSGCVEDAEQNIENDFACSMKERYESAASAANEYKETCKRLSNELEKAHSQIKYIQERFLSKSDCEDLATVLKTKIEEYRLKGQEAAKKIVEFADNPTGADFSSAVRINRSAKHSQQYYEAILSRLMKTF